jgi:hypothetical protein
MKELFIAIIIALLLVAVATAAGLGVASVIEEYQKQPEQPKTLNMELYSVTPHGHQVFKKCENGTCVFVLVRHHDGYPIAITSTCE